MTTKVTAPEKSIGAEQPALFSLHMRKVVWLAMAVALLIFACSKQGPSQPSPPGLDLRPTKIEVVGAGAASVTRAEDIAKEALKPLKTYYEGTLFGRVFPVDSFDEAFADFTPTVAAKASGEQSALMTPADIGSRISGVLEAHELTSTVTIFAPAKGVVSHAGISVSLRAVGLLDDGTPIDISRNDFFIVEKSSTGWKVITYECRQKIDAPSEAQQDKSGGTSDR